MFSSGSGTGFGNNLFGSGSTGSVAGGFGSTGSVAGGFGSLSALSNFGSGGAYFLKKCVCMCEKRGEREKERVSELA